MMQQNITDYSEIEFIQLVKNICLDTYDTEEDHIAAVMLFEALTGHPDGSDLIYYPEHPEDGTPENIVRIVKQWRRSQGLPCFKE